MTHTSTEQPELTHQQVLASLHYNPDTGVFTRRSRGRMTGRASWNGYISIDMKGRPYRAHRLAWFYMNGSWPDGQIDHIDGDVTNNRISNLRVATRLQNNFNSHPKRKTSGLPRGVRASRSGRTWFAQIRHLNKTVHLGTFDSPEDAGEFYALTAELLHGEFAFHLSRAHGITQEKQG